MLLSVLLLVCVWVGWLCLRRRKGVQPPMYPGAWPVIGHAHMIFNLDPKRTWQLVQDLLNFSSQRGGTARVCLGPHTVYVVTDPDDFSKVSNVCLNKPYFYKFSESWVPIGMVTIDTPQWKSVRKLLSPMFNHQSLTGYMEVFNEQSRILVDKLAARMNQGNFTPNTYILQHTLDTAFYTTLGIKANDIDRIGYSHAIEDIFSIYQKRFTNVCLHASFVFQFTSLRKELDSLVQTVADIINKVITRRKFELAEIEQSGNYIKDKPKGFEYLLDTLIGQNISENEIRQQIDNIIIGGYDTTSITLNVTLLLIGSHPNVQKNIFKELQEVFGDSHRDLTMDDLIKLKYINAVLLEGMRLYPMAPFVARQANQEVKLKNYTIPAGGTYVMSPYAMHRLPIWGADAEMFRPERWLEPGGVPDNPNAFGAFSLGKRNCIGKVYAMMFAKTTLVHILRRYNIKSERKEITFKWGIFRKPTSSNKITVHLRS